MTISSISYFLQLLDLLSDRYFRWITLEEDALFIAVVVK